MDGVRSDDERVKEQLVSERDELAARLIKAGEEIEQLRAQCHAMADQMSELDRENEHYRGMIYRQVWEYNGPKPPRQGQLRLDE